MKRVALALSLVAAMFIVASVSDAATRYFIVLTGGNENPPTPSAGTGSGFVDIDTTTHQLHVNVVFSGLASNTTMAHIHCCIAPPGNTSVATPVPAFPGFPLGATSGAYEHTLDLTQASSWNAPFITNNGGTPAGAEAALAAGAAAGQAYFNIHTTNFPPGEIRAFLVQAQQPPFSPSIPTLSGWAFVVLGVLLMLSAFVYLRRRAT
ncbi:MAG: PEP-CTERM sorting domain-containing protein [Candidatus Rokuibacteriota bacterium]|nr:MAG: PEP-CTERM sorting domain-containing protein [Candidatus Rokubacteria bacterium]